jgi:hypothetical protein
MTVGQAPSQQSAQNQDEKRVSVVVNDGEAEVLIEFMRNAIACGVGY